MVVRAPPPLATGLPNGAFWSASPRLVDIVNLKSFSAKKRSDLRASYVSSEKYLAASLSLPPESEEALNMGKFRPYPIKSVANADAVIALFKEYGFSHTQIANIFSMRPGLLAYNPDKFLKPKLDVFLQSGIARDAVILIIASNPYILSRNLHRVIIPCLNFLTTTLFHHDYDAVAAFLLYKRPCWIFYCYSDTATPVNVATLRSHGVPEPIIVRLALLSGTLGYDPERFSEAVRDVMKMGFDPQSINFLHGLRVYAGMTKEKWASKMGLLKKLFGLRDDRQVQDLFMKQTCLMSLSEDKLIRGFEIFVERIGWTPQDIAKYPSLLACSFEKRILPRFSVLEILLSEGLVNKTSMGNAFLVPEKKFLAVFVEAHEKKLPKLMEIYIKNQG